MLASLFENPIELKGNLLIFEENSNYKSQNQTNSIFSEKWLKKETSKTLKGIEEFQKTWYIKLYGFSDENDLASFLRDKKIIFDAGCGLGYKAAWFAKLSPGSIVIGMDFSEAAIEAAKYYKDISNLFFIRGDIADTKIRKSSIDYISCDQVIHHTQFPEQTFSHLTELLTKNGEIACYVYAKKALPRELLDEYFRSYAPTLTREQLWEFSEQVTELGRRLSELNIDIKVPDMPVLAIKGGTYSIQRFIYWNFLKCFWNEEFGWDNSVLTNFDWYGPSNAARYSEEEFRAWVISNNLEIKFFHKEEACYTGRFCKPYDS
ncbi:MAG: class I SAM-dependent methyltransferase [Bacteroidota bacterium]